MEHLGLGLRASEKVSLGCGLEISILNYQPRGFSASSKICSWRMTVVSSLSSETRLQNFVKIYRHSRPTEWNLSKWGSKMCVLPGPPSHFYQTATQGSSVAFGKSRTRVSRLFPFGSKSRDPVLNEGLLQVPLVNQIEVSGMRCQKHVIHPVTESA